MALRKALILGMVAAGAWGAAVPAFSGVRDLEKKIKSHQKELEKLQDQIRDLESEKIKLKKDEQSLAKTLKRLEAEIEQSTKKQVRLSRQIRENEAQIKRMGSEIQFFSGERAKWDEAVSGDVRAYYVNTAVSQPLRSRPMDDYLLRGIIRQRFANMKTAETRKNAATEKENRLLRYKKNLVALQAQMEEEIDKQKKSQAEKNQLYKTTLGKRLIAEQEAQRLRETSESLETMIRALEKRKIKEKTLAEKKEAEVNKRSVEERKGSLPWPVAGSVAVGFGKHKHPDLNINVINNGLKIRTAASAPVKAVEKGVVVYAADFRSYGQTVIVDHGGEFYSIYGLLGNIAVKDGDKVLGGTVVGSASKSASPQVYFEFRNQGHPENPLLWLKEN